MTRILTRRITLTLVVLALSSVRGQTQVPRPAPPKASVAQRVLLAAYPELRARGMHWRVVGTGARLVLEAREAVSPLDAAKAGASPTGTAPSAPPLMRAVIELDAEGALLTLRAGGTLAPPSAFTALQAGPSPTAATLRAAGAKFPPDDPAGPLGLVPVGVVQALGSQDIGMPTFTTGVPGQVDAATWRVELIGPVNDPFHNYTLVFEPLEGRLLSVVRR